MFDTLTLDQLYDLHQQLCDEHDRRHNQMMIPGHGPRIDVFGNEWALLSAKNAEINETAESVYAEIQRRQAVDA